ncbi:unnamed protein product [Lactuca virosa]|uniref:TF-B3 domain-containing protein n=1 Tax=Lactuca virosa TaxID=75947 RepID=A0AAU9NUD4_9ASTR|nr:unnamed protein product [Lactuca virosa]
MNDGGDGCSDDFLAPMVAEIEFVRCTERNGGDVWSSAHLLDGRASAGASVDSARQNLAATFVNAFVNAGFGQDKQMTVPPEASSSGSSGNWLFKNKEHGKASAATSLQHYLDRYFIARRSLPALSEVGLTCFRESVYEEAKGKAKDAVIALIDQEREGEQIDRALLKNVIGIYVEIGMGQMDFYEKDFETDMLVDSAGYYSRKASNWIVEDSCPDYMLKAEDCLRREKERVAHYLHSRSESKLLERVQNELLVVYSSQLLEKENSGCRTLLRDDKVDDLSRMYRLFSEIPKGLDPVANMFKQHVTAEGMTLVQQAEEAASSNARDEGERAKFSLCKSCLVALHVPSVQFAMPRLLIEFLLSHLDICTLLPSHSLPPRFVIIFTSTSTSLAAWLYFVLLSGCHSLIGQARFMEGMCGSTSRCSKRWRKSFLLSSRPHGAKDSNNQEIDQSIPHFNLKSKILCRVVYTQLLILLPLQAEQDTDEVYAQITLLPEADQSDPTSLDKCIDDPPKASIHSFYKVLTASDTSTHGGFSVLRKHANECLPTLDMSQPTPTQELVAKDLHGIEWRFKHIFRGQPRRHLLTTGWSTFVIAKRLVAVDSFVFLRVENGELRVWSQTCWSTT